MVVVNEVVGDGNLSLDERVGGADGTGMHARLLIQSD
jgi:hypothetical protein